MKLNKIRTHRYMGVKNMKKILLSISILFSLNVNAQSFKVPVNSTFKLEKNKTVISLLKFCINYWHTTTISER